MNMDKLMEMAKPRSEQAIKMANERKHKREIKDAICNCFKFAFTYDELVEIITSANLHVYECVECLDPQQGLDVGSISVDYTMPNIIGNTWKEII